MRYVSIIILLLSLLLPPAASHAAAQTGAAGQFVNAMTQGPAEMLAITQDEKGVLWMGTAEGLYSYDGYVAYAHPRIGHVGGERIYSHSFNVGTIRLLKGKVRKKDFVEMKEEITKVTSGRTGIRIIGSGGNINKLYRLASKKEHLDGALPVGVLQKEYDVLSKMSVEERMAEYGLKPDRADVIVPAAEIFLQAAANSGATDILVPNLGLAMLSKYTA